MYVSRGSQSILGSIRDKPALHYVMDVLSPRVFVFAAAAFVNEPLSFRLDRGLDPGSNRSGEWTPTSSGFEASAPCQR